MSLEVLLFFILSIGAIASGVAMVTRRNPVTAAMMLVLHFFMLSGLYLTLNAQFMAVIQILVYAGAIMVLVVFVIMLLNLGKEENLREKFSPRKAIGTVLAAALIIQLLSVFLAKPTKYTALSEKSVELGTVEAIGMVLFTDYLFPFEAVSLLLLAAVIGAVILSKRKLYS